METKARTLLGYAGVDSGMLMVCDPGYIKSEWIGELSEAQASLPYYEDKQGQRWGFAGHAWQTLKCLELNIKMMPGTFADPLPDGTIPNELIASGEWTKHYTEGTDQFSFNGCCTQTTGEKRGGQMANRVCSELAVAVRTGGDGAFPVYAEYDESGRVVRITIEFQ